MSSSVVIKNKKARFEYHFIDTFVAGIQLTGTEIKSIRNSKASITEGHCTIRDNEAWIRNMYIEAYENGGYTNHEPRRERKLLLNRSEIKKIDRSLRIKGHALVPVKLFINASGLAKLEIALASGKKLHDKRQDLKSADAKRDMDRAMKV